MTNEQKSLEILRSIAQIVANRNSISISHDWGFGTATIVDENEAHTHIGSNTSENEEENFNAFINALHDLVVVGRGLSWNSLSWNKETEK